MIKYIDCDGVILDTETGLFDEYHELKKINPELKKRQYLHDLDWEYWIWQASVLNDAVEILKSYDPKNVEILTRVHSLQEARAKINYFRLITNKFLCEERSKRKNIPFLVADSGML